MLGSSYTALDPHCEGLTLCNLVLVACHLVLLGAQWLLSMPPPSPPLKYHV